MNKSRFLSSLLVFTLNFSLISSDNLKGLKVNFHSKSTYISQSNEIFTIKYYKLSDNSLNFIKLELPDGNIITLPQVVSASGEKYSINHNYSWCQKGDSAFLEKRKGKNWVVIHRCTLEK